ncbi:uncharacterized protein LOC107036065 [Diachasma alloeum]|uniref:uncharacterized protein LOC107036065 n=1 Tax=Diachasma alloeum TaxID=454923 RepID=UPI0007382A09|nr:uncharacterized protein LOC107036065 [Diachasma alloeum]
MESMEAKINGIYSTSGVKVIPPHSEAPNAFPDIPEAAQWWRDTSDLEVHQSLEDPMNSGKGEGSCEAEDSSDLQQNVEESEKIAARKRRPGSSGSAELTDNRGRVKNPENWKVNLKKNARLRGEEYVGGGGKIVPAKVMGPPCDCRSRCGDKVDEESRAKLHEVFWKTCNWDQRKQYVALSVKESPKHRTRARGKDRTETRRHVTFTYSLLVNGECITVCKPMFLSTFSVSEKFVRHAMEKKRISPGGIIGPDQRGRHTPKTKKSEDVRNRVREHIQSFPTFKSENPRERKRYLEAHLNIAAMHKLYVQKCEAEGVPQSDIVKESYYREMFRSEFNYGFKAPPVCGEKK